MSVFTHAHAREIRASDEGNNTHIIIPLQSEAAKTGALHSIFTLVAPPRLVIDVPSIGVPSEYRLAKGTNSAIIKGLRQGMFAQDTLRLVVDLHQDAYVLQKTIADGMLKLTLRHNAPVQKTAQNTSTPNDVSGANTQMAMPVPKRKPEHTVKHTVIMIDAGHGGKDPGALGKQLLEKDLTLHYAKLLQDALHKQENIKVHMVRNDDRFVLLGERVEKARAVEADIFISLHADSNPDKAAQGFSVYTLSDEASDVEAAALAQQENKADIVSDINLDEQEDDVATILIDLLRRETKNKSSLLAESVIAHMPAKVRGTNNTHRYAGFAVLKAPDVPSILVEMGFLSNEDDELALNSPEYQALLIRGIVEGVMAYIEETQ